MNMLIDLRMEGRIAVVFGGGTQGERKAKNLLRNGARVLVVSRSFSESLKELGMLGELELLEGDIEEDFNALSPRISGADLVFAATDSRQVNTEIARRAKELGTLVCAVDIPAISDFYSPAVAQKGSIRVGVCTDGKSPLMSRLLRQRIEKIITEEDVLQVELQAHARKLAREKIQRWEARREVLYRIAGDQEIKNLLAEGRLDEAKRIAEKIIET